MIKILIPRENHHTRLFTAYRASQIYDKLSKLFPEVELVDLNCEKLSNGEISTIILPIEWNSTLTSKSLQTYINDLSNYNKIIITGRYANCYKEYVSTVFQNAMTVAEHTLLDIDALPSDLVFMRNKTSYAYAPIESSIGCFGKCSFCSNKIVAQANDVSFAWTACSPTKVVELIKRTICNYGIHSFCFLDNNFIGTKEHAVEIAEEILCSDVKIKFSIETRVDCLEIEIIELLKKAGLRKVMLGLESGSDSFLKKYKKGTSVEQNVVAIEALRRNNINVDPQIIMFYPDATYSELGDTLNFIKDNKLYNCIANGGAFITKMMVFDSKNPEDMYNYDYADQRVALFENELKKNGLTKISSLRDCEKACELYNMFE